MKYVGTGPIDRLTKHGGTELQRLFGAIGKN